MHNHECSWQAAPYYASIHKNTQHEYNRCHETPHRYALSSDQKCPYQKKSFLDRIIHQIRNVLIRKKFCSISVFLSHKSQPWDTCCYGRTKTRTKIAPYVPRKLVFFLLGNCQCNFETDLKKNLNASRLLYKDLLSIPPPGGRMSKRLGEIIDSIATTISKAIGVP